MLQNIQTLHGNTLAASDGEIGHVKDFYFDDKTWAIRYLVADTGSWLTGRQVLISPHALGRSDVDEKTLSVNLTRQQIENSPSIDSDKPVSRQYEIDYYNYYGWPTYWYGGDVWGAGAYPVPLPFSMAEREAAVQQGHANDDKHLCSVNAVTGYAIQATDGEIGTVSGFMVNDRSWVIGEAFVETGHWYAGKQIRIPTSKINLISYEDSKVFVNLSLADLRETGEYEVAKAGHQA